MVRTRGLKLFDLDHDNDILQGCFRHDVHLVHCFLRNGFPRPSGKLILELRLSVLY